MRILQIDLTRFGRFDHFSCALPEGFTVVYGENEAGKSTIMDFLQLVFYGTSKQGSDPREHIRKRYVGENDRSPVGVLHFEQDGKRYRLTRRFGATNGKDDIQLAEEDTGKSIALPRKQTVGELLFGLDADAFKRSVYIGSTGTVLPPVTGNNGDQLMSRLLNLQTTGEETTSATAVAKSLQDAQHLFVKSRGKGGLLFAQEERIRSLQNERNNALLQEEEMRRERQVLEEEKQTLETCDRRLEEQRETIARLQQEFEADDLRRAYQERKKQQSMQEALLRAEEALQLQDGTMTEERWEEANAAFSAWQAAASLQEKDGEEDETETENREALTLRRDALTRKENALQAKKADGEQKKEQFERERITLEQQRLLAEERLTQIRAERARLEQEEAEERANFSTEASNGDGVMRFLPLFIAVIFAVLGYTVSSLFYIAAAIVGVFGITWLFLTSRKRREKQKQEALFAEKSSHRKQAMADLMEKEAALSPERFCEQENVQQLRNEELASERAVWMREEEELFREKKALEEDESRFRALEAKGEERKKQRDELKARCVKEQQRLRTLLESSADDPDAAASQLSLWQERLNDHKQLSWTLSREEKRFTETFPQWVDWSMADLEAAVAEKGLSTEADPLLADRLKEAQRSYADQQKKREAMAIALAAKQAKAKEKYKSVPLADSLLQTLHQEEEKEKQMKEEYQAVQLAQEALQEATEKARHQFSPLLNSRASAIFQEVSGREGTLRVDTDMDVRMEETDFSGFSDWRVLSTGTIDQVYFSLRIALAEVAAEKQDLPLFFDDAFAYYDDRRAERAMDFLARYAKEKQKQILLFTAHHRFVHWAKEKDISCLLLREGRAEMIEKKNTNEGGRK